MKTKKTLEQCNMTEREGQVVFTLNSELFLPEDAPVRLTSAQLEELNYRKLYEAYSSRGRKSVTDETGQGAIANAFIRNIGCITENGAGFPHLALVLRPGSVLLCKKP